MAEPYSSAQAHPESGLESTTESEGDANANTEEKLTKTSARGVDLFEPFQVKATADLNIFESEDESQEQLKICVPSNSSIGRGANESVKGAQKGNHLDEKQRRAHGVHIDIKACLKTLCHGRVPVQYVSDGTEAFDCATHLLASYKSMRTLAPQQQWYTLLKNEDSGLGATPEIGLGLAAACKERKKGLNEKQDSSANELENDFVLHFLSDEAVIPHPPPHIEITEDSDADRNSGITGRQDLLIPAVAHFISHPSQGIDKMPSMQNLISCAHCVQTVDGIPLPPPLENAWYFRFTSTGDFKTPMDYAIDKLALRTCSYTYSAMCGTKSLLFNYYVAGDTSYDPVLIIPDFYQTPLCVAPLINLLVRKKKCAYILDISTIATRLMTHEIIVCYTEFILNVCLHFRTAGRRRSSTVGMGIQETARKISLIGQGSGANVALKLAIAITILSDGLDTLYTYDFARLVTARLMRDGMSSVNLTTMLSIRSVILCNPHMPTFETVLRNKNPPMSKLIKQPRAVNSNRSALLHALGYDTGMIASSKMPIGAFPNPDVSSSQTLASVKPNYLSFCPQELLDFYKTQITTYNKAMFLSMSILGKIGAPVEDEDGPTLSVFEMYAGLTPLHRSSFPLNIFLGSDYNLFSGTDLNLLSSLGDDNTTVLLRTVPGCGVDMLNTCKDILCHML
ncbi:Hypothetical protein GLP15_1826 [Giardia lamblia P15]|uniref:Uncharacterized protein n=1 Tax=Giardia intestinalis (strain P15) TaxID=658858 RepID=E1EYJ9_GIAIA|nr:Hypothetical protein GLP15_1826 [Giardia lamblia P15]